MACSERFLKGCAGKVQHKTFLGAEASMMLHTQNRNATIYPCEECGFFHIGTPAKKKSKRVRQDKKQKANNEHKKKYKNVKKFKY